MTCPQRFPQNRLLLQNSIVEPASTIMHSKSTKPIEITSVCPFIDKRVQMIHSCLFHSRLTRYRPKDKNPPLFIEKWGLVGQDIVPSAKGYPSILRNIALMVEFSLSDSREYGQTETKMTFKRLKKWHFSGHTELCVKTGFLRIEIITVRATL